jgi:hypothetical protein
MLNMQTAFLSANQALFAAGPSPVPDAGNNLFTFLASRLSASFANMNCAQFGLHDTVNLTTDDNGVATAATFNLAKQAPGQPAATGSPSPSQPSQPSQPAASDSPWTPWNPGGQNGGVGGGY